MQKSQQRIAKQVRVISVVESEFKLIKIAVKMLHGNLMIGTNDRTLEQTPDVLEGVSMNDAAHVFFLPVSDRCVKRVLVCNALISLLLRR